MRINTNIPSLNAQRNLGSISRALSRSLERLSSGSRINSARDDASGLAVSLGLKAQAKGLTRTIQNMNEAFGYLNAADGALQTQMDLVQRMRELAVQAANGSLSTSDRSTIQVELNQLMAEFSRTSQSTLFNGTNLLGGELESKTLQVGTQKGQSIAMSVDSSLESDIFVDEVYSSTNSFSKTESIYTLNASILFSDLTGDGLVEMIAYDSGSQTFSILQNDGNGAFSRPVTFSGVAASASIRADYDFNNDGNNDLLFGDSTNRVVWLSDGYGGFSSRVTTVLASGFTGITSIKDFNNDGNLDLLSTNSTLNGIIVNFGNGKGSFASSATVMSGTAFTTVFTEDLNGDGYLDVFAGNTSAQSRYIRMGSSSGTFSTGTTATSITTANSGTTNVADVNNDGYLDFIDKDTLGNLEVRFGNASWTGSLLSETAMGTSFSNILTGDIDGDGDTDVLAGDGTAGSIAVRLNTGSGIMSATTTMTIAAGTTLSAVEDINADGRDDVIATSGMNLYLRLATGAGNFASTSTTAWSGITMFPQIEDINQDGYMDLIGLDYMFPTVSIMLGNSSGFSSAQSISRSTSSSSLHNSFLVDLNNDGFKDVFLYDIDMLSGESMTVLQGTVQSEDPTSIDLTDQESAEDALEVLDRAIGKISERRAEIGALQNRLTSAINANSLTMENLSSAYSQIMDTDIAQETAELTRSQIQQQAAAAVLGQANIALQMAIQLLNS